MNTENVQEFTDLLQREWLPNFCHDPRRQLQVQGFRERSIRVSDADARDCVYAVKHGVVVDQGGGRFRTAHSTAFEQLFWTGSRSVHPRPLTLWLEPVITFAALGRLHRDYAWPIDLLGSQPKSWAFDLAAHDAEDPSQYRILGEVKKSLKEVNQLIADLHELSAGNDTESISKNSRKKWLGLMAAKPSLVWIIGPDMHSRAFWLQRVRANKYRLVETSLADLDFHSTNNQIR